jgi:multicomponent Na+:H+ antiporter subunit D
LLFFNAGAVEHETNTRDMKKLGGLARAMPVTSTTSLGASLSISGIPPFNGFFSKLIIIIAAIQGKFYLIAFLAVLISIVTLGYFFKFQKFTFFNKPLITERIKVKEAPFTMCFSMIILAILCLGLSLLIVPDIREIVLDPAVKVLMNASDYSTTITGM